MSRENSSKSDRWGSERQKQPKLDGLSIKTKLTLVLVLLVVSSLSIVGFIASSKSSEALSMQAQNNLLLVAAQKTGEYSNIFTRLQDEIEGVAIYAEQTFNRTDIDTDLGFRILMPWTGNTYGNAQLKNKYFSEVLALQRVGLVLQGLVQKNSFLELGYMATRDDFMVLDNQKIVDVIEAETGYIPTRRPWYLDAADQGRTIWTQPYVDVNTKKLIVSCATPVYRADSTVVGVVGFDVLLDTIQKDIISLDIGYDSQAFLLSQSGKFLVKPGMNHKGNSWGQAVKTDNALATDDLEFRSIVKKMLRGARGLEETNENGEKYLVAFAPLPAIDASVGIKISYKEVMRPATEIQTIIASVWVVVVLFSVICGLMIGNGITRPINNLSMRANLVSLGELDLDEITEKRKDEIGVLIESFNRLVVSLKIAMSRAKK